MKLWLLAGLFTFATVPVASALDMSTTERQADDNRREAREDQHLRVDAATPAPNTAEVAVATRDAVVHPRRRSGKRIPDAELIAPRGAL